MYFLVATKAMKFQPSPNVPALQYVGNVDQGGCADLAGLKTGDFIIEVRLVYCYRGPMQVLL